MSNVVAYQRLFGIVLEASSEEDIQAVEICLRADLYNVERKMDELLRRQNR